MDSSPHPPRLTAVHMVVIVTAAIVAILTISTAARAATAAGDITAYGSSPLAGLAAINVVVVIGFAGLTAGVSVRTRRVFDTLVNQKEEAARLRDEATIAAATDQLTGLANRREFDLELERLASISRREQAPLSVVVFDLDHFKTVNDTLGHDVGDAVLCEFANRLESVARRDSDIAGHLSRWGGEEFVLLLYGTDMNGAVHVAEQARAAIATEPVPYVGPDGTINTVTCTVSAGVASVVSCTDTAALIKQADNALYAAKDGGRNQVATRTTAKR